MAGESMCYCQGGGIYGHLAGHNGCRGEKGISMLEPRCYNCGETSWGRRGDMPHCNSCGSILIMKDWRCINLIDSVEGLPT